MTCRTVLCLGAFVAACCCTAATGVAAQQPAFVLDLAAQPAQDVTLPIQGPTVVPLRIFRTGAIPANATVDLDLTPFTSDSETPPKVTISLPKGRARTHLEDVPFNEPSLTVDLHVPALSPGAQYDGRLLLTTRTKTATGGQTQPPPVTWRFVLKSTANARPATMVVNPSGALALDVALPRWSSHGETEASVLVQLRDKTGKWPIDGVMLRVEQGLKTVGSDFDASRHITATFDGDDNVDLFATPASGQRHIAPGGQATAKLAFHDLEAGEYTIPLQFSALNSGDDASQRLTITLQVRNNLTWAVIVLIAAALASFIATRVVIMLKQRAAFLGRVQEMRPNWLGSEEPTLPVIWLRATLRQAEDLSHRFWLTGQKEIDDKLKSAQGMLDVLTYARQVRNRIDRIAMFRVRRRATWKLDDLIRDIPAAVLRDEDVAHYKAELGKLGEWCDQDKMEAEYWADLLRAINKCRAQVDIQSLTQDAQKLAEPLMKKLDDALMPAAAPANLTDKVKLEDAYQRLEVLWQLRDDPAATQKMVDLGDTAAIEDVFAVLDDKLWERVTALKPEDFSLKAPAAEAYEAYSPITFELGIPGHPELENSYLVRKKLTYHWKISIPKKWPKPARRLPVDSKQPRVAQYSPHAGRIHATVQLTYMGRPGPEVSQAARTVVTGATAFSVGRIVELSDFFAFTAALLMSIASGLALYALKPHFGSFADYLALFTWGAGLDQGKNFVQSLAAYNKR